MKKDCVNARRKPLQFFFVWMFSAEAIRYNVADCFSALAVEFVKTNYFPVFTTYQKQLQSSDSFLPL
jgi:hypothetical protein